MFKASADTKVVQGQSRGQDRSRSSPRPRLLEGHLCRGQGQDQIFCPRGVLAVESSPRGPIPAQYTKYLLAGATLGAADEGGGGRSVINCLLAGRRPRISLTPPPPPPPNYIRFTQRPSRRCTSWRWHWTGPLARETTRPSPVMHALRNIVTWYTAVPRFQARRNSAGFKRVEALGRIIIRGPYPPSDATIYVHLQL